MSDADLPLGVEKGTGDPVSIPITHTLLTGKTRHGKSETMKTLAEAAVEAGYAVLLFDVKTPRDYEGMGRQTPVYIEEGTNPTRLKGLLESSSEMSLSFQFPELIKVYEPGDTYRDILNRTRAFMEEDRHPVEEDKLRVIDHLLNDLLRDLENVEISDTLDLEPGINVMDLHHVGSGVQQIAIQSTVDQILKAETRENVIIGVDEAHNFIPQRGNPPANETITRAIREGGAKEVWVWLSDQTITGVDKDPLKQVGVWILGKQREKNEAGRVLDQIPGRAEYASEDVMTLDKGHFIVALDEKQPLVYVRPRWVDDETARQIATGETTMDETEPEPDRDEVADLETRLEEKDAEIHRLEQENSTLRERTADLQEQVEGLNSLLEQSEAPGETDDPGEAAGDPDAAPVHISESRVRAIVMEEFEELRDHDYFPTVEDVVAEIDVPDDAYVDHAEPRLVVRNVVEPLHLSTDSIKGKIAILYAEGELPEDEWFTTGLLYDLFQTRGWDDDPRRAHGIDDFCKWGYFERKYYNETRHYRLSMTPAEAEERGRLNYEEEVKA
jgi:hypothetical protein